MYCPKCNKENPDDARFCNSCGTALTQSGALSKIEKFLEDNSRKMAELYGEEFADSSRWGPDIAARLILAYIDRDKGDKLWYKKVSKIKSVPAESKESKLIVCSCHTGFLSHTSRALMVAQKLRELGHEVVFAVDTGKDAKAGQRKYVKLIEDVEPKFRIYHLPLEVGEDIYLHGMQIKGGTMGYYNTRKIEKETANMLNFLREIEGKKKKPDIMLTDHDWVVSIPADIMDIPVASSWNFLLTNYNKNKMSPGEKHPIKKLVYKLGGDDLVELLEKLPMVKIISGFLLFKWVLPYDWVRIKYMLKEKKFIKIKRNMYSQICGDLILFPDYVAFGGMKINHKALPVGPILWEPEASAQDQRLVSDFEKFLEKDKQLIYVTMGSTGMLELFKLIIEALKDKDYRIAITTGEQFDISDLGELPENFFVIPFYPGKEICKKASLMINHGGSGSLNQAIENGLPQICIPTHVDQQWNSDLVAREGLGKQILLGNLSVESLSAAVEELLPKK